MSKTFLHISEEFEYTWLGKDNGMIPIYMSEKLGYDSKILTVNLKNDLPDSERGVEFVKVKRKFPFLSNFAYWTKLVKRYNIFIHIYWHNFIFLFHVSRCSYWYAHFYKKLNPNGFIYVKADFNLAVYQKEWNIVNSKPKSLREFFRKRRESAEYDKRKKLIPMTDLISYESLEAYEFMKDSYAGIDTKTKTIYLPNGYDNEIIDKIKVKTLEEKENIILTVGRWGTEAKNTELLLETFKEIDLKDWKVYLVGSIDKRFINYKENFFKENPHLVDKIIFTGEIKDREELYKYYNRAKVFVLPSRWESFGIVMVEAMAFGDYVITSNTCAAKDITNNNEVGKIIEIDSKKELKDEIIKTISGEIDLKEKYEKTLNHVSNFKYSYLIEKLGERIH